MGIFEKLRLANLTIWDKPNNHTSIPTSES